MANGESEPVGPRGKRFGPGEGPQLLAHLQATGAEVIGSDGEKMLLSVIVAAGKYVDVYSELRRR